MAMILAGCDQSTASRADSSSRTPSAAAATQSPTPVGETFGLSPKAATIDASLSVHGPTVDIRVSTNFPAFKSNYYIAEIVASTPESVAISLPKCARHERACNMSSNTLTDALDCDGVCHPGIYTLVVSVFAHNDGTRIPQSTSFLAWVGGESGTNLAANPQARPDPLYPASTCLKKEVRLERTAYT
jgi:hypothetical protein